MTPTAFQNTIAVFEGNADGEAFKVHVFLRGGQTITGTAHPEEPDQYLLWLDVDIGNNFTQPTAIDIDAIDAIGWAL